MSKRKYCSIPTPTDINVAESMGFDPKTIANLRGLYESKHTVKNDNGEERPDYLINEEDYRKKLIPFVKELQKNDREKLRKIIDCKSSRTEAEAYRLLQTKFKADEIRILRDYMQMTFSAVIDALIETDEVKALIEAAKKERGYVSRRDKIGLIGSKRIHEALVNSIYADYTSIESELYNNDTLKKMLGEITDTGDITEGYFNEFLFLAKNKIRDIEGVDFGKRSSIVIKVKTNDKGEEELSFGVKTLEKDNWMRNVDKEHPITRKSQIVKQLLGRQMKYMPVKGSYTKVSGTTRTMKNGKIPIFNKGFRQLWSVAELASVLHEELLNCRDEAHMMRRLERLAKRDVNFENIYEELRKDDYLRNAFFIDFNATEAFYNKITRYVEDYRAGRRSIFFRNMTGTRSNKRSFSSFVQELASENASLEGSIFRNDKGEIVIRNDNFKAAERAAEDIVKEEGVISVSYTQTGDAKTDSLAEISKIRSILESFNRYLSLGLTTEEIESILTNRSNTNRILDDIYTIFRNSKTSVFGNIGEGTKVANLNKKGIVFADRLGSILNTVSVSIQKRSQSVRHNKATYFKHVMRNKISDIFGTIRSFSVEAFDIIDDYAGEEQTEKLEELLSDLRSWIDNTYGISSEYMYEEAGSRHYYNAWLEEIYNTTADNLKNPEALIHKLYFDRTLEVGGIDAENSSESLDMEAFLGNYFRENESPVEGFAGYAFFTTGDSLVLKSIEARKYKLKELLDLFAEIAFQEVARMRLEALTAKQYGNQANIDNITRLKNNEPESTEITGNFTYLRALNNYKEDLSKALFDGRDTFKKKVREILKRELFNEYVNDFWAEVKDLDCFKSVDNISYAALQNLNLGSKLEVEADGKVSDAVRKQYENENLEDTKNYDGLYLFYLNSKLAYINQFTLLGANIGNYGKPKKGLGDAIAMQKRYKAFNTPGTFLNVDAVNPFTGKHYLERDATGKARKQKVLYYKDNIKRTSDIDPMFMEVLKKAMGKNFKDIVESYDTEGPDVTDGQGYRTLSSYKAVMGMSRRWDGSYEAWFRILQGFRENAWERAAQSLFNKSFNDLTLEEKRQAREIAEFTTEEMQKLSESEVALQGLKAHTPTVEHVRVGNDTLIVSVEHKYAEALLVPEFYKPGSIMRTLGIEMELKGIDMACSQQCVKVGEFGSIDIDTSQNTPDNKVVDIVSAIENAYLHEIDYKDYSLLTENPEHINNPSQLFNTQIRKHVFNAIAQGSKYMKGDEKLASQFISELQDFYGEDFIKLFNSLVCENIYESMYDLSKKLSDVRRLSDMLTDFTGRDFGHTIDDLARFFLNPDKSDFEIPLGEPINRYKTETNLLAQFKNSVNKQRINGGSCIQVSDFGISPEGSDLRVHYTLDENGEPNNITYVDLAMAWSRIVTEADGTKINLKFTDYCDNYGYLLPSNKEVTPQDANFHEYMSYTYKLINGRWVPYEVKDPYHITEENVKVFIPKIEVEFPQILDILAFRIPTEKEYSIINGKVKRFFPKIYGGRIMCPGQYVKVAGFDFKQYWSH